MRTYLATAADTRDAQGSGRFRYDLLNQAPRPFKLCKQCDPGVPNNPSKHRYVRNQKSNPRPGRTQSKTAT